MMGAASLPVYVINLDRRPDRLAVISDNLKQVGITWERITAIDGALLPETGPWIDRTTVACTQSHCKALRAFLATSHPAALVLEDDAIVASDTPAFLESIDWWPAGHGLLKLDTVESHPRYLGRCQGLAPTKRHLRTLAYKSTEALGYLIDRASAQIVLNAEENEVMPFDCVLFHLAQSATARRLIPVWVIPALVLVTDGLGSDIEPHRHKERFRRSGLLASLKKVAHKLKLNAQRVVGSVSKQAIPYRDRMKT